MIKSFANKETAALFAGHRVRHFGGDWLPAARRKLAQLNRVAMVEELLVPPGNRLERLSGDREGQWSIRINGQWRICFRFHGGDAYEVEIVDYH